MNEAVGAEDREATLGAALLHLLPRLARSRACPSWPPDVFAIAASLLDRTGAYVHIVNHWPLDATGLEADWRTDIARAADTWLARLRPSAPEWPAFILGERTDLRVEPPERILAWWSALCEGWDLPLADLRANRHPHLLEALMGLLAVADETCGGVGLGASGDPFLDLVMLVPQRRESLTICLEVHPAKARVLPKQHTPQRGLTLRSLSVHLALANSNDLAAIWHELPGTLPSDGLNILLLPWPLEVHPRQFTPFRQPDQHRCSLPEPYGFFRFAPEVEATRVGDDITEVLARAARSVGRIDVIVLPELALTVEALGAVRKAVMAFDARILLVAGVWGPAGEDPHPSNHLSVSVPLPGTDHHWSVIQRKHHRWCLDRDQILQYGLGGSLTAARLWWEHSEVAARELNFVAVNDWLTFCPLICEDLARQDPAADVIRSVGPNLVIALLMDGPQLPSRWPGRYASVLAEDPGSSVLTLTSLGMARLARPRPGHTPKNRVVGLWRDALHGEQALELPDGADALVLSIAPDLREEWTADGRRDGGTASFPVFCGVHAVPVAR